MKKIIFIIAILATFFINVASAQSVMKVKLVTGTDDLRSGNNAYISVNYTDGTSSREYSLGGGYGVNSVITKNITLERNVNYTSEVKNIVLRHDGAPRAGNPFDTYENWDLQSINVSFVIRSQSVCFVNSSGNPLVRFSGTTRTRTYAPNCGTTPDLTTSSTIKVYVTTGSDDLRTGNRGFIKLNYIDGSSSQEYNIGGGFAQNSLITKTIDLQSVVNGVDQIKNITIRHDGSPRAGNPFDMYDNWDLQTLRVTLVIPGGKEINIVNASGNPLKRFTGAERTKVVEK